MTYHLIQIHPHIKNNSYPSLVNTDYTYSLLKPSRCAILVLLQM